ncbi:CBS domain-containing protein [Candidatus Saccharibacteria bacterium]|jgi:CBS domain containing-hemolysin-like protein|nr:CBS domain-containing protein [Candidatus Saccharibacteria bacterium]
MFLLIMGLLLAFCCLVVVAVYSGYVSLPTIELKRRARRGDVVASVLYRAVCYGVTVKILLVVIAGVFAYGSLVCLERSLGVVWASLLAILFLFWGIGITQSRGKARQYSIRLATWSAPVITWVTERTHPILDAIARRLRRIRPVQFHTGVYEKADLVTLLETQSHQPDNRIPLEEINLLKHALTFGDKLVGDVMTPKRVVSAVSPDDTVAPVLMDSLHATGHSRFPVVKSSSDSQVVGVLYLHEAIKHQNAPKVSDVMRSRVIYIHQNYSLFQALQAFLKTQQHLFIVVDEFEEYVGVLTIEDVIEQVIGSPIVDEFDKYDDLRAVAASAAKREHKAHQANEVKPNPVEKIIPDETHPSSATPKHSSPTNKL